MNETDWAVHTKGLLKAELARRNVKLGELAERLKAFGIEESSQNLSNKINRGTFSAIFMLQVLQAIGCENLNLKS